MQKRISPAQAAKHVLKAFPYGHAGAEISSEHVAEHFRRRGYPGSEMVAGCHYAVAIGWVERTNLQSLKLTMLGVNARDGGQTSVPPSTFDVWARL